MLRLSQSPRMSTADAYPWLLYLPPRFRALDKFSFDVPQRPGDTFTQGRPPGPQRLTGRELRVIAQNAAAASGTLVARIYDVAREANLNKIAFLLTGLGPLQVLTQNSRARNYISLRNSFNSAGNLFVGFGAAGNDGTADYVLEPGGQMLLDGAVPQDDLFISTDAANTFGAIAYSLVPN